MKRIGKSRAFRLAWVGVLGLLAPLRTGAQQPTTVPPGTPVTITVTPAAAASPSVTLTLGSREGHATPHRKGCCHTGGGNLDVAQPSADTVVVTLTGVAVAVGSPCGPGVAGIDFDLSQCLEVVFEKSDVKAAKLTIEGRLIGLLRSHCKGGGSAQNSHACASVSSEAGPVVALCLPDHAVACGENLSVNDHEGPVTVPIGAGKYTLHQAFHILASHPRAVLPCKAPSAEFAPDPALDPLWISYWEPFHGAAKKDFGFQITLKVAPADVDAPDKAATNGKGGK